MFEEITVASAFLRPKFKLGERVRATSFLHSQPSSSSSRPKPVSVSSFIQQGFPRHEFVERVSSAVQSLLKCLSKLGREGSAAEV